MTPQTFLDHAPITAESLPDYVIWHELLQKWNRRINLVADSTIDDFWTRHALDSAQILPFFPEAAMTIVDFGSGAGFPALSIAIEAKHTPKSDRFVHLIESSGKKASFLKSVSRETSLPTLVHNERIEAIPPLQADVITARAFAPLNRLLPLAASHLAENGRLVLLKGETVQDEIEAVSDSWSFKIQISPSQTSDQGSILEITDLRRK